MLLKQMLRVSSTNYLFWGQAIVLLILLLLGYLSPETVVFGYFFETIIIGSIHALKLFLVIKHGKPDAPGSNSMRGYGMIVFFLFHYGMFVAIQMVFVFTFFDGTIAGIKGGFDILHNIKVLLYSEGMAIMLGSLLLTNLGYFYNNFWTTYKYREYAPGDIFFSPYVRIFIQQFVVIFTGFFFVFFNAGVVAALLLIIIRLGVDLLIVSIKKDSNFLKLLSEKLARPDQSPEEIKRQLEKLSE
ncbi:hypothetical protein G5B37_06710 [Rasiella rasia]|uniref:Uncharacterized protein n=1 Tax=Rasiella rasia TaxID=2744027 RepID=A0A6G6GLH9_9FLAO|nr:DUF6498-containing protein [Rasiella rasia]QIE59263.1 hypothetical protein G5B37_06710 [Rasiella rasia]